MKSFKYIIGLVIWIGVLASCSKTEDPIVPENLIEQTNRFKFPEGNNAWDQKLVALSNTFDVTPIYKGFTPADFNKKWVGFSSDYTGTPLNDELANLYTNFLVDEVFHYYVPEIANKVLPMYIYMVDGYGIWRSYSNSYDYDIPSSNKGFDYWLLTFKATELQKFKDGDPLLISQRRNLLNYWCILEAVNRGFITEPAGFKDNIDYTKALSTIVTNADYFAKRGFVGKVNVGTFATISANSNIKTLAGLNNDFLSYISAALFYPKPTFEQIYPAVDYPLIKKRYDLVVNHLRDNYGIDLQKIASGEKQNTN